VGPCRHGCRCSLVLFDCRVSRCWRSRCSGCSRSRASRCCLAPGAALTPVEVFDVCACQKVCPTAERCTPTQKVAQALSSHVDIPDSAGQFDYMPLFMSVHCAHVSPCRFVDRSLRTMFYPNDYVVGFNASASRHASSSVQQDTILYLSTAHSVTSRCSPSARTSALLAACCVAKAYRDPDLYSAAIYIECSLSWF
jgi:hypothetical protein